MQFAIKRNDRWKGRSTSLGAEKMSVTGSFDSRSLTQGYYFSPVTFAPAGYCFERDLGLLS
jgi:hypothetical protein